MKKNTTIWTYVKRAFLIVLLTIVVIFVSVYFLDVYKVSANIDFDNEYEDSYWDNLEGNGFISYEQYDALRKQEEPITLVTYYNGDYIPGQKYEFPFDENATNVEKIQAARFEDELNYIYQNITKSPDFVSTPEFEQTYEEMQVNLKGYTRVNYLDDLSKIVLSNDKYDLYFDATTTQFILKEKNELGEVINEWSSTPKEYDDGEALNKFQKSIFTITCVDGNKAATKTPIEYNSYTHSCQINLDKAIEPTFFVNAVKDKDGKVEKIIVYYKLEQKGIDITYLPEKISLPRMRELIERCNQLVAEYKENHNGEYAKDSSGRKITEMGFLEKINGINPATGEKYPKDTINFYSRVLNTYYDRKQEDENGNELPLEEQYFKRVNNLSEYAIGESYRFLYEWCGYTIDELVIDTGVEKQETTTPKLSVAIEYKLGENGLEVMVPGNSIKVNKNAKGDDYLVTSMKVLPYFTSLRAPMKDAVSSEIKNNKEGYLVIPDGSGAIMEFNNGKTNYNAYSKRIYTSDLTFTSYTLTADTSDILLPMYAYVFTGPTDADKKAMVVEALDGAAQVSLNADTSNRGNNTFNYAYYSITFRESQKIVIGTNNYNRSRTTQYTNAGAFGDYRFGYMPLDVNEYDCSYNGVAKFYRDLIVSRSEGRLDVNGDNTTSSTVDLEVLGAYSYKTNFIGIGYTGKETLTTVEELKTIIDEITNLGVKNLNVYYKGWRNTGLLNTSFEKIKVSNLIGGKKELLNLINEYKDTVNIYPYLEFLEYETFQESFGKSHYTSRDIGGEYATRYPYELNSNVFNKKLNEIKILSPAYYDSFSKELSKNYEKVLGINTLALTGLGSDLSGDYRKKRVVFKSTAVNEQIKSFLNLEEKGINNLALESPYAYALEFASNAYNVPYESTQYEILDYNVPFYQLVINGLFDYSGESFNKNVEKGLTEHMMKCIETGSNPSFTFTYDDSSELLQTDYNTYYYTLYSRWLTDVKKVCNELDSLGIYNARLVSHERLGNDVYKVTYQTLDGNDTIEIILNYQRTAWTDGVNTVSAKSYSVIG